MIFPLSHLAFAYQFLTRLPAPRKLNTHHHTNALWACIVIGLLIGVLISVIAYAAHYIGLSTRLIAWIIIGSAALITGAIHEDGLADICDGMFGGYDKKSRITIMKDPKIGLFAVLTLLITKNIEAELIIIILNHNNIASLIFIACLHGMSRGLWPLCLRITKPIISGKNNLAHALGQPPSYYHVLITMLIVIALAVISLYWIGGIIIALALFILTLWWAWFCKIKLGGVNGDCLGALQQFAFILALTLYTILT